MLPNLKPRRITGLQLASKHLGPVAKCPPRYSEEDWDYNNKIKFRITCDQEKLAERIVEESRRVVDETKDTTKNWQREVEHHMRERTSEIRFLVDELNRQKKTAALEDETLNTYRNRVLNAIEFFKEKSLAICKQCLILREGRIGVDLCDDEVDRSLRRELKVIKGCQGLADAALKEAEEQIRKLRAAMYLLDQDLAAKDKSLAIDEKNLKLKEFQQDLGKGQDLSKQHCQFSLTEWQAQTYENLEANAKALVSAGQLRAYIDLLLKQVCEDMQNQTDRTNEAFERRIAETKHVKQCLENKHKDTMDHIHQVQRNMNELEREMSDKQRAITLCQTRLSNRAHRPGLELTCDMVQDALYNELQALKASVCKLNQKLNENKASMRYLMHVQVMQEEEINIKANSCKIDEVDCMTLRQALKYTSF
ncbi:tektin-1 [Drosophila novamexicana]|uniref:tektin-1 n=1 Tax=Drosophila novamexicana TaxID=47314 RepID=UPI0011E5A6AA|nr:tektin-1 [Drosophila novamexicana]